MTDTKIKICGLMVEDDIRAVNEAKVDFAGFMFYPKSRRYVDFEKAAKLKKGLSSYIKSVGVFVNEEIDEICRIAGSGIIDLIQLHGSEDELYIEKIRSGTGLPVIKAFRIESREDAALAEKSPADYILLDNGAGGTGESFDWSLLTDVKRDFFLAGGLDPSNVSDAVKTVKPWAVDVSSGVETDKRKDYKKIIEFAANIRGGRKL